MWGEDQAPKWVHTVFHTLNVVPMSRYIETELQHGIVNWEELVEGFLMTFSSEDDCQHIEKYLQVLRGGNFKTTTTITWPNNLIGIHSWRRQ